MQKDQLPVAYALNQDVKPSQVEPSQYPVAVVYIPHNGFCASGGEHVLDHSFTTLGVCLGVLFFPVGILCCLGLRETRCVKCGSLFT
ncbi:hypothetical protein BJ741DRAFT_150410 [Chytriomyces cf. hyalinus JEL632]|nr:hypothetical protein BJ741DRAFT_150410 [Chytriomyces cf. hyalinus JEL632]